jgi:hypothetical protein
MNMTEIEVYNKNIREEFEKKGGIDLLTKYVMSEIIPPVGDYFNAINIIRANYHLQISGELLIIGAYLTTQWTSDYNDLLGILNLMYNSFPVKERSIVNYLNACEISMKDNKYYRNNSKYIEELKKSICFNTPFVYNHYKLAEVSTRIKARKYYTDALNNVIKINSEIDINNTPFTYFLEPCNFINENILGTHLTYVNFNEITEKINSETDAINKKLGKRDEKI